MQTSSPARSGGNAIRSTLQTAADHGVDDDNSRPAGNALLTSFKQENFYLTDDAMVFFTQPDQDTLRRRRAGVSRLPPLWAACCEPELNSFEPSKD